MSTCVGCERPMPDDQAYGCVQCAQELADALRKAAGHAEDVEAVLTRQTRYGTGGRGGSDEPMPGDLTAAARLRPIENAVDTWARVVLEETEEQLPAWRPAYGPLCPPTGTRCAHDSCDTIRRRWPVSPLGMAAGWLATQTTWLRKHPAAGEAFAELHDACQQLARLVDRPADKDLVGMCDCGRVLYAAQGKTAVTCPTTTCGLHWNVERSREILRQALDDKLVTASEAARLGQYLDTDRTQEQIRKLINSWASRGELTPHPLTQQLDDEAEAAYRFGEVAGRLARTPRRTRRGVAA